jgi:hypothetical protein
MRTGLAGTTVLQPFELPRFPDMLVAPLPFGVRSVGCPKRPYCSQPSAPAEQSHVRRTGALLRELRHHEPLGW